MTQEDSTSRRMTTATEELVFYNLFLVEALEALFVEKGVLSSEEIKQRVKKLRRETRLLGRHFR